MLDTELFGRSVQKCPNGNWVLGTFASPVLSTGKSGLGILNLVSCSHSDAYETHGTGGQEIWFWQGPALWRWANHTTALCLFQIASSWDFLSVTLYSINGFELFLCSLLMNKQSSGHVRGQTCHSPVPACLGGVTYEWVEWVIHSPKAHLFTILCGGCQPDIYLISILEMVLVM